TVMSMMKNGMSEKTFACKAYASRAPTSSPIPGLGNIMVSTQTAASIRATPLAAPIATIFCSLVMRIRPSFTRYNDVWIWVRTFVYAARHISMVVGGIALIKYRHESATWLLKHDPSHLFRSDDHSRSLRQSFVELGSWLAPTLQATLKPVKMKSCRFTRVWRCGRAYRS